MEVAVHVVFAGDVEHWYFNCVQRNQLTDLFLPVSSLNILLEVLREVQLLLVLELFDAKGHPADLRAQGVAGFSVVLAHAGKL